MTPVPDLHTTRQRLLAGLASPAAEIGQAIACAASSACAHAFLQTDFDGARAQAAAADPTRQPLAGLAVSVKDLFDVAGQVSRAGSVVLTDAAPARQDAVAVARLRAAGAALIGRSNMSEFAYSGVGVNPHHGTPANAVATDVPRVPGGSSSGAAVSVATGAAFVGLGSDTGGSIRIPAALQGLVGFKSTQRLVPLDGTVPLSSTLDTACAITRSVRDAITVHEILAARRVTRSAAPLSAYRLAVVPQVMFDGIDATVARGFERTLRILRDAGARIEELPLPALGELAGLQASGGFAAAESYAWHRHLLADHAAQYDPRVLSRIQRGATISAADYIDLLQARRGWIARVELALAGFDAVLSPTVPIVAPPLAGVLPGSEHDETFFRINGLLLRNPSVVNMLDGCAISLPCHTPDELPVGLMVWQGAMRDDVVLNIAQQIENLLRQQQP
ncbi:amidase [Curvibacter sp. PAE-UM]|uniref:amidase n=1 Tax=Curvibacter sp. PAE-UM TaxID=1714344 RepID=UPI0007090DF7|nr:amidase [Curvibacter sp. PAE-UM]KRI00257.1 amidase [Curvibacter sp. PAE-UM]